MLVRPFGTNLLLAGEGSEGMLRRAATEDVAYSSFPSRTFAAVRTGSHTGLNGGAYARSR
ncbi:hypothetical protein SAMN05216277_101223 [Halolamina pelagica]|uniref:Uncharacterized protein n=1 Tax=Halolamina pelagica TaxID=699431 RepID=A0A1I5MFF5_9EURY|nr:hypothetical protein SAMN05216277_101223 [Halolamina pelagica]